METLADLWDALPTNQRLFGSTEARPAKVVAAPASLSSLPTEILLLILAHCNSQDVFLLMQVNRAFHSWALPILYATVHIPICRHEHAYCSISAKMPMDKVLPFFYRKRFGVLGGLLQRSEHVATLRYLHIDDFPLSRKAVASFHRILRYILDRAINLRTMYIHLSNPYPAKFYLGVVVTSTVTHTIAPALRTNLIASLLDTSRLHLPPNTSECRTFRRLRDQGEQLTSSLCELSCTTYYIPQEQWKSFTNKYEDFISTHLHLSTLQCAYCMCDIHRSTKVQEATKPRVTSSLPELTAIAVEYRRLIGEVDHKWSATLLKYSFEQISE